MNICGREPADAGRFPKTRAEEDADVRRKEAEAARKRNDEAKLALKGPPGGAKVLPPEDEGGETEAERIRRLMGRGSGEGLMEVEEGALQIAW